MNDMRKLLNLMEGVVAVPGLRSVTESESDMQTASTAAVDNAYSEFDMAQGQATEESVGGDDVAEYKKRLDQLWAEKNARLKSGMEFGASEKIYGEGYQQLLRDMPEAHNEYVRAQNARLWAGNDWQRDDKSARSAVDEEAPPGMEDVVMDLKKQYPDDHSKAFATAWSIYNKKHGKTNESVPAVDSCNQDNPASADVACAMEENMTEYDNNFIAQAIKSLYPMATSEEELRGMVAGETGYGSNPEFDSTFTSELDKFLGREPEEFGQEFGGSQFEEGADNVESRHGNALRKLEHLISKTGYKDGELAAQTGNTGGAPISSALDIWYAYQDAHPELMNDEGRISDRMEQAYNNAYEQGFAGLSEAYDMQNGYNDVDVASGKDYFPNGADSPVVDATGAAGARQGDNPEQKKMQVAETHRELVYAYRKFLKESAS